MIQNLGWPTVLKMVTLQLLAIPHLEDLTHATVEGPAKCPHARFLLVVYQVRLHRIWLKECLL